MEFAILILQTELLTVKKSLRIIERMEYECQTGFNSGALKIQEAELQKAINRLQEAEQPANGSVAGGQGSTNSAITPPPTNGTAISARMTVIA